MQHLTSKATYITNLCFILIDGWQPVVVRWEVASSALEGVQRDRDVELTIVTTVCVCVRARILYSEAYILCSHSTGISLRSFFYILPSTPRSPKLFLLISFPDLNVCTHMLSLPLCNVSLSDHPCFGRASNIW